MRWRTLLSFVAVFATNSNGRCTATHERHEEEATKPLTQAPGIESLDISSSVKNTASHNATKSEVVLSKNRSLITHQSFEPLTCNQQINLKERHCTTPWSTYIGNRREFSDEVVIHCGECIVFDFLEVKSLVLAGGLDIQGKLVFPEDSKSVIKTPYVRVQGILEMTSRKPVDGHADIRFQFPGSSASGVVSELWSEFTPADSNHGLGPQTAGRGILVAGGQVQIEGLPHDTPSSVPIVDVVAHPEGPVDIDPSEYPTFKGFPTGCNADGVFLNETFFSGDFVDSSLSVSRTSEEVSYEYFTTDQKEHVLRIKNRADECQGLEIDVKKFSACLASGETYLLTARVRLQKSGVDSGTPTECASIGEGCLVVKSEVMDVAHRVFDETKYTEKRSSETNYGAWFTISIQLEFWESQLKDDNVYHVLRFEGPRKDVNIEIDNVVFRSPPRAAFRESDDVCQDLVPGNNGAEDVGFSPFPFYGNVDLINLEVKEEGGNKFFAVSGRDDTSYSDGEEEESHKLASIAFDFPVGCVDRKVTYRFRAMLRVHPNNEYPEPAPFQPYLKGYHNSDPRRSYTEIATCPQSVGEWIECETDFVFTEEMAELAPNRYSVYFQTKGAPTVDYDVDNITFSIVPAKSLTEVVVSDSIKDKWNVGASVLLTSNVIDKDDQQIGKIESISNHTISGYLILGLSQTIPSSTSFKSELSRAPRLALMSRNFVFEGFPDDAGDGVAFVVKETPDLAQTLEGITFINFGQNGESPQAPVQFQLCGNVFGSRISKNLFLNSSHHCTALDGTSNVQVVGNVAYESRDRCFLPETEGGNQNVFSENIQPVSKPDMPTEHLHSAADEEQCKNLVYNGHFEARDSAPWFERYGGDLSFAKGAGGKDDFALSVRGLPMQSIRSGCLRTGTTYEVHLKYKLKNSNRKTFVCDSDQCLKLQMLTVLGRNRYVKTIARAAGLPGESGWSNMYGLYKADEVDSNPDADLKIAFKGVPDGTTIIIDNVTFKAKPKDCSGELTMNSNLNLFHLGFWRVYGQGAISKKRFSNGDRAIRISGRQATKHGLQYQANSFMDLRCITAGTQLQITADFKLYRGSSSQAASCDVFAASVSQSCPSVRIVAFDASNPKKVAWRERIINGAYQSQWVAKDLNRFRATTTVPKGITEPIKMYIVVRDFNSHYDLLISNFGIKIIDPASPNETQTPEFPPPSAPPEATVAPTHIPPPQQPPPTILPSPTNELNVCPEPGKSIVANPGLPFEIASNLCTLSKVSVDFLGTVSGIVPVARSYDRFSWERAPGSFAGKSLTDGDFLCSSDVCEIKLPTARTGETFVLSSYSREVTSENEIARFLEMGTFGSRRSDLLGWKFSSKATWVEDQVALPPTSHREYWRKRTNPRWRFSHRVGRSDHPCSRGSRWRKFAFTEKDKSVPGISATSGDVFFEATEAPGQYVLSIDGHARAVVKSPAWESPEVAKRFPTWDPKYGYTICKPPLEYTGSALYLNTKPFKGFPRGACEEISTGNPSVDFNGFETYLGRNVFRLSASHTLKPVEKWKDMEERFGDMYILPDGLSNELCDGVPEQSEDNDAPIFAVHQDPNVGWVQWDPRLSLQKNTLETPLPDGGGGVQIATGGETLCANAPRTFLNADRCVLSDQDTVCGSENAPDVSIELNRTSILKLHELTGRYVYGIEGLAVSHQGEQVSHPCTKGVRSRWEKLAGTSCSNPSRLGSKTRNTLSSLLSDSKDPNTLLRDIVVEGGMACDRTDRNVEIEIQVGDSCWKHVHPEHMSVWDLTYWTLANTHPGNKYATSMKHPHPIKKFLDRGGHLLPYPSNHPTDPGFNHPASRWDSHHLKFDYVGRFGDTIAFRDLPNELRLEQVAEYFGERDQQNGKLVVVCGSPGEVSNDPWKISDFDLTYDIPRGTTVRFDLGRQREISWTMIALYSEDQLRQRMAWALSQVLAIAKGAIAVHDRNTEAFVNYYDIFVRNAFGNYLDILREISYSPMQGENLSYLDSRSSAYVREKYNRVEFADENFAREIMQLFSTGLVLLNLDGTPKLSVNNVEQRVYSNADIRSVSRVWTGFRRQEVRGNIESRDKNNRLDPMKIEPEWRDRFPKSDLNDGFIGDGYPLCVDLPDKQFLKRGAKYRLLGSSPLPHLVTDDSRYTERFRLESEGSALYARLCERSGQKCTFPVEVTLESNLPCYRLECEVDTVRVVQVGRVFYEYARPPCVEHPFFDNGMKLNRKSDNDPAICGNRLLPIATSACCEEPDKYTEAVQNNVFEIERMTFATQDDRCRDLGRTSCEYDVVERGAEFHLNNVVYHWAFAPCRIQVKVNPAGEAAIVHDVSVASGGKGKVLHVDESTTNYFQVGWNDGAYPQQQLGDCGSCEAIEGENCLCDTSVEVSTVFKNDPASSESILARLRIGAPDPASFDTETYESRRINDFTVHMVGSDYTENTIFEVVDEVGRKFFLKNAESTVLLQDNFSFRNPVQFMSLVPSEATARDAEYETEAFLEHLFYHDNTAPFLCTRFIQRFGTSNPSPRYVKACSTAFRAGKYLSGDISFGTGKYGDLAATVAAVLLDREPRSVVLDVDPSSGSVREPLLKVIGLMRSAEFKPKMGVPGGYPFVVFDNLNEHIGQMAHEQESVFSFFLSEYQPDGPVSTGTLVAPEAQLLDTGKIVNTINGLHSLIKYGLSECDHGFGFTIAGGYKEKCLDDGRYQRATGMLTYRPTGITAKEVVDELSTLLTSGRLDVNSRKAIMDAYDDAVEKADTNAGVRIAQQLITTTPEFHTTSTVKFSGESLEETRERIPVPGKPYKAVVMLMFAGGCDSFNLLVPKTCSARKGDSDAYSRYVKARAPAHLLKQNLLPIDGSGQVSCSTFGVHEGLPIVQRLYNDKDLVFFANTGSVGQPSRKETYAQTTPSQLFAHNTMQRNAKRVDLFDEEAGTGVLGRLADALSSDGLSVGSVSIDSTSIALVGEAGVAPPPISLSNSGVNQFMPSDAVSMTRSTMVSAIEDLNNATNIDSGFMASTWSKSLIQSLRQNEALYKTLRLAQVSQDFGESDIGRKLEIVTKMIQTRKARGKNSDVFYVEYGGWDHHSGMEEGLSRMFSEVNVAVSAFVSELKKLDVWSSTTVVQVSEFARTLSPNSGGGTDHAWGGNYFMFGGSVKGGRILGEYPEDLSENGKLNVGRGRFIPTKDWSQIWPSVARWSGVDDEEMLDKICPNRGTFPSEFSKQDLFEAA